MKSFFIKTNIENCFIVLKYSRKENFKQVTNELKNNNYITLMLLKVITKKYLKLFAWNPKEYKNMIDNNQFEVVNHESDANILSISYLTIGDNHLFNKGYIFIRHFLLNT